MAFEIPATRSNTLQAALYVVATPIGNLSDITVRALQTLSGVDLIACEDTRVTGKLLAHFSIRTKMIAYHDHNSAKQTPAILDALAQGRSVALVSDAGTPLVSDPGYRLVEAVLIEDYKVIPIPGASSPIAALSASGLPNDAFLFSGFLPPKQAARKRRLEALSEISATLVFLESPKRLIACLEDCIHVLGGTRKGVVAREITKLYETFSRGSLEELAHNFALHGTPKGEIVLLVGPPGEKLIDEEEIDARLTLLLKTRHVGQAAEILAAATGLKKRDLYQRALVLKKDPT